MARPKIIRQNKYIAQIENVEIRAPRHGWAKEKTMRSDTKLFSKKCENVKASNETRLFPPKKLKSKATNFSSVDSSRARDTLIE